MSSSNALTEVIIPLTGTVISNVMYYAPMKAVQEVKFKNSLDELNPIPFPLAVINTLGWLLYSLAIKDFFVFFANIFGIALSLYFTLITFPKATREQQHTISTMLVGGVTGLFAAAMVDWLLLDGVKTVMGLATNAVLICYYSGPLGTLATVVRTKNSAYFNVASALASTINASFWTIYGFAISNLFIR
jgi:solute carrier family 50 protein (sugar transporter)